MSGDKCIETKDVKGNRNYKDSVFRDLFTSWSSSISIFFVFIKYILSFLTLQRSSSFLNYHNTYPHHSYFVLHETYLKCFYKYYLYIGYQHHMGWAKLIRFLNVECTLWLERLLFLALYFF